MINIFFFEENQCKKYIVNKFHKINGINFVEEENELYFIDSIDKYHKVKKYQFYEENGCKFIAFDNKHIKYKYSNILLASENSSQLQIKNAEFYIKDGIITPLKGELFLNYKKLIGAKSFKYGDSLLVNGILLVLNENDIRIFGNHQDYRCQLEIGSIDDLNTHDTLYAHSRFKKEEINQKVKIKTPKFDSSFGKKKLMMIILPPVIMILISIVSSIMFKRGLFVIIMMMTTIATLSFSVVKFIQEQKENKFKKQEYTKKYTKYLSGKLKLLNDLYMKEKEYLEYTYLNTSQITKYIEQMSRIYERNALDDDFLKINIGLTKLQSKVDIDVDLDITTQNDEFVRFMTAYKERLNHHEQGPMIIDLQNNLAVLYEHHIDSFISSLVNKITFYHSYYDVKLVFIGETTQFDYLSYYRHFQLPQLNLCLNLSNEQKINLGLSSLTQILRQRLDVAKSGKDLKFEQIIFIIYDYDLVLNHPINEFILQSEFDLKITIIYLARTNSFIPQNIKNVIRIDEDNNGRQILNDSFETNNTFVLEKNDKNIDFEMIARNLGAINYIKQIESSIPKTTTLLELYRSNNINDVDLSELYTINNITKSMRVPIGKSTATDIVYLDLHEKYHGPHGLIAGTTGSGKSEIIQTIILSLAMNFTPEDVGFLLIDFKGGGMANLFKNLPHLLGIITNLDGNESLRALISIRAELKRRQDLFNQADVNNINSYTTLYKNKHVDVPLPHLLIIADEFAELKKEQPEFMSELISIARIGRTLGIHLILATQKPAGVVDGQIWSNSKFKIALKVQDESDSKEILKTPDAAYITQPGRAYLQVGANEIYELFQTAYTGGSYLVNNDNGTVDKTIYMVNKLEQLNPINSVSHEIKNEDNTELEVIIDKINTYFQINELPTIQKPWCPPLPNFLYNTHLDSTSSTNKLTVHLGIEDIPEQQTQQECIYDFIENGHLSIYGSNETGKTLCLENIILELAQNLSPEDINFYLLDYGNNNLFKFSNLVHCIDYLSYDDDEKYAKLTEILQSELSERRIFLKKYNELSIQDYNDHHQNSKLPYRFVIIDMYEVYSELYMDSSLINILARDGQKLGIYLIITSAKSNALPVKIFNNIKQRLVLNMNDTSTVNILTNSKKFILDDSIKGRAILKSKNPNVMQLYSPFKDLDDNVSEQMTAIIDRINANYQGYALDKIPVMPEHINLEDIKIDGSITLGLKVNDIQPCTIDDNIKVFKVCGINSSGRTTALKTILQQLDCNKICIIDNGNNTFTQYQTLVNYYIDSESDSLNEDITQLIIKLRENKELIVIIDDIDILNGKVDSNLLLDILDVIVTNSHKLFCSLVPANFKVIDPVGKWLKSFNGGIVLSDIGSIFIKTTKKMIFEKDYVYYLDSNNDCTKLKLVSIE